LAAWSGCGRLPNGEIFVLIPSVPTSLDGRYFGPTPIRAVIGRVTPLWLSERQTR
nr:conjugal transfer protein TraF [Pseudomonadota bacterium]